MARHLYMDTAPVLLWFTVLTSLISLVIIHIVVVTSISYGLSRYALEMVVRVLVLELIPLTAAMFVALRCALPNAAEIATLRAQGVLSTPTADGTGPAATRGPAAGHLGHVLGAAACHRQLCRHRGSGLPVGPRRDHRWTGGLHADVWSGIQSGGHVDLHRHDWDSASPWG